MVGHSLGVRRGKGSSPQGSTSRLVLGPRLDKPHWFCPPRCCPHSWKCQHGAEGRALPTQTHLTEPHGTCASYQGPCTCTGSTMGRCCMCLSVSVRWSFQGGGQTDRRQRDWWTKWPFTSMLNSWIVCWTILILHFPFLKPNLFSKAIRAAAAELNFQL